MAHAQTAADRGPQAEGSSVVRADLGTSERVVLSLHKAKIIELPQDSRDVLVTNPAIADVIVKTPRRVYLLGKSLGDTNVFFFNAQGRQILRLELRVDQDLSSLRDALKRLMPGENIDVSMVNQTIALTGTVSSPQSSQRAHDLVRRFTDEDAKVVNMTRVKGEQQVMMQVRISEMSRSTLKNLGISWEGFFDIGGSFLSLGLGRDFIDGGSILRAPNNSSITGTYRGGGSDLSVILDALERDGLVKTLAEPNLTAISGENAKFLVGGEFPVPVSQREDRITVIFKEFGVLVTFTPVVLESGLISLRMAAEVSQVTDENQVNVAGFTIPSLTVRRTETTVELPSGGSLVVAGLLQNVNENTVDGLPFLKDLPILGSLFRSVAFTRGETELVITVSPVLVKPVDDRTIPLPTDGFAPVNDFDLYFLAKLEQLYTVPGRTPSAEKLQGPLGYIME